MLSIKIRMHWLLTPKFKVDFEIECAFIRILRRCPNRASR